MNSLLRWTAGPGEVSVFHGIHGRIGNARLARVSSRTGRYSRLAAGIVLGLMLTGCGSEPPKPASEAKPPEPAVPEDVQDAAKAFLGSETQVLLYGDLAHNGNKQILAANVVPNTPKSVVAGTVVRRAVIAENENGKWMELFRADEYLKNQKGYLGLTPRDPVSGWRLQYENTDKGMSLYLTPIKSGTTEKTLPIAVRWDATANRYRSMDLKYENFLNEVPMLQNPRSLLR